MLGELGDESSRQQCKRSEDSTNLGCQVSQAIHGTIVETLLRHEVNHRLKQDPWISSLGLRPVDDLGHLPKFIVVIGNADVDSLAFGEIVDFLQVDGESGSIRWL